MKSALIFEEQFHQEQKPQEQLHSSPPLLHPFSRQLMLEDISPKWSARLETESFPTFMSLTWFKWYKELRLASKCVVGEAHGHSSIYIYTCNKCDSFGNKFMYYFLMNWHRKLDQNKQRFVKHWNEHHNKSQIVPSCFVENVGKTSIM